MNHRQQTQVLFVNMPCSNDCLYNKRFEHRQKLWTGV